MPQKGAAKAKKEFAKGGPKRCRKMIEKKVPQKRRNISRNAPFKAFFRRVKVGIFLKKAKIRFLCRWAVGAVKKVRALLRYPPFNDVEPSVEYVVYV